MQVYVDLSNALLELYPDDWATAGLEDIDSITWKDGHTTTDEERQAIELKMAELKAQVPMRLLRVERNRLLADTDWWASSDLTMTAEQTAYRQALRDITNTATSLDDVVWPEKPE